MVLTGVILIVEANPIKNIRRGINLSHQSVENKVKTEMYKIKPRMFVFFLPRISVKYPAIKPEMIPPTPESDKKPPIISLEIFRGGQDR